MTRPAVSTMSSNRRSAFDPLRQTKTIALTTFRRDGTSVTTPVSIAFDGERAFFRTWHNAWKAKRLATTRRWRSPRRASEDARPGRRSGHARGRSAATRRAWPPAPSRDAIECFRRYSYRLVPASALSARSLGFVGHTHVAAAWQQTRGGARRVRIRPAGPLDIATGKWLLNPGAAGAPVPSRLGWWDALEVQAAAGAFWLLLDLEECTATWQRAPFDPLPARTRAHALGLDHTRLHP